MLIVTVTLFRWLYIPTFIAEAKWGGHLVSATILALLVVWSEQFTWKRAVRVGEINNKGELTDTAHYIHDTFLK